MSIYIIFFFSLAFDFKGANDGGSVFQFIPFFAALLSGGYIIIKNKMPAVVNRWHVVFGILLIINLIFTFPVALIQSVELDRYIRVVSPYILLVFGYFVGVRAIYRLGFRKSVGLMMFATIVATVFTVIYGYYSTGQTIDEIRYQILSPMIFVLVPVLANKLILERRNIFFSSILLTLLLMLILISSTRSWLIAYFGVVLLAISISKTRSYKGLLVGGGVRSVIIGGALMAILLLLFIQTMPDVMNRLVERIFTSKLVGFDITTATRIAEIDYQIDAWMADLPSFLIGRGLGASYGFSGQAMEQLTALFGYSEMDTNWWFAGHNFWIYSLFAQGLFFGMVVPFVIVYALYTTGKRSFSTKFGLSVKSQRYLSESRLSFLIISSIVLSTIGGNPLGSRMLSQYIGIIISMSIAVRLLNAPAVERKNF